MTRAATAVRDRRDARGGSRRSSDDDQMRAPLDDPWLRCSLNLEIEQHLPLVNVLAQLQQKRVKIRAERVRCRKRLDCEVVALQKRGQFRCAKHVTLMGRRRIILRR